MHPIWGEVARACVVLKSEYEGKVREEDILKFFENKVAKWQTPKSVGFYASLPKTSVGKIDKKTLRAPFTSQDLSSIESMPTFMKLLK